MGYDLDAAPAQTTIPVWQYYQVSQGGGGHTHEGRRGGATTDTEHESPRSKSTEERTKRGVETRATMHAPHRSCTTTQWYGCYSHPLSVPMVPLSHRKHARREADPNYKSVAFLAVLQHHQPSPPSPHSRIRNTRPRSRCVGTGCIPNPQFITKRPWVPRWWWWWFWT